MSSSAADSAGPSPRSSNSPRQDVSAKLFLGGLSWDTSEEKLREHFEGYGELVEVVVMRDRMTGRPRGFGFVTFRNSESADRAIDVKKSVPQEGKPKACKVFVGGLSPETTEGDLKSYFSKFGDIAEVQIMQDHMSGRSRGFGFITFDEDSSAERVFEVGTMHEIGGKKVEVKAATPKGSGSLAARQQQQHLLPIPPLLPQQQSPMRGRSSAEYDPAMMRAFGSGMPGPAGYPAYPIMYGYGGRPPQMMPPGGQGSYNNTAATSLSQFPGMQHGHYMMMPSPSGMGPPYTPTGYSYQQQQSYTSGGGGGGGMPYTPPSPQGIMQHQHQFSSPGMYPSSGSPSPPYRASLSSGGGGEVPRSKSSASRTKVDSASSLDAHAQIERQFKRMGLDR